jgi:hypothetical protein
LIGSLRSIDRVLFKSFFLTLRLLPLALTALPRNSSLPFVVPSEDHSHEGRLGARLFREGRETTDANQFSKKKIMKTTKTLNEGLLAGSANHVPATAPQQHQDSRLPIDSEARKRNRTLPTEKVLNLLLTGSPELYRLAEVVGKWVWVTFKEQPAAEIRQQLAQLGFHWNRERQAWQHPCGQFSLSSAQDPHQKYSSYYPADHKTA